MIEAIFQYVSESLWQSVGLASAFCPLYVASAALTSFVWLRREQGLGLRAALHYAWDLGRQNQRSIGIDSLWVLGQVFLLRVPIVWVHVTLFDQVYDRVVLWNSPFTWDAPLWFEGLLATGVSMLAIDFAAWLTHRALHSVPWLWAIHRLHHSATFLTPLSTFRQNPLEPLLLNGMRALAAGVALGLLHAFLPNATGVWMIGGMGVGFFLYMFTVNLHHAPLPVRYPRWLRWILISPHVHHIHHSAAPEHFDHNFGVVFSVWDRWFGTYLEQDVGLRELRFGLEA